MAGHQNSGASPCCLLPLRCHLAVPLRLLQCLVVSPASRPAACQEEGLSRAPHGWQKHFPYNIFRLPASSCGTVASGGRSRLIRAGESSPTSSPPAPNSLPRAFEDSLLLYQHRAEVDIGSQFSTLTAPAQLRVLIRASPLGRRPAKGGGAQLQVG